MKIKLDEGARLPERAFPTDAGLDLFSREEKVILPGESATFDTGVHVELPEGTYGHLEAKSGLNFKYDVLCLAGTIDHSYRGSIGVKLYNLGKREYMVRKGQKIVQLVVIPCVQPELEVVDHLEETDRNERGFGSTGL